MLNEDENRTLTQVGPGTPMGELLRRYWHPVAAIEELEQRPTKRVKLLGEYLVLFKDGGGNYGLLEARCAHRGTDLTYGIVEDYGLRCFLHGWLYSETGQCIDQPLEPEPFAHEIRIKAYKVAAKAGMLWAYLGPEPAPLVPDWEPFTWDDGLVQVVFAELPCNWLQCQENAMDPVDVELFQTSLGRGPGYVPPPLRLRDLETAYDEFDHGFVYRRARRESDAPESWSVGRTCLWPNGLFAGNDRSCHFEWRVPVDDTNTLSVAWFIDRAAPGATLPGKRVYHWYAPVTDEDSGKPIETHPMNRSFTIWLHQAPVVDRTRENLVASDRGIVMLRDKYFSQIGLVSDGGEPKGVLRDEASNKALHLPFTVDAAPQGDAPAGSGSDESRPYEAGDATSFDDAPSSAPSFPYLAGQPEEVAAAYRQVIESWERLT